MSSFQSGAFQAGAFQQPASAGAAFQPGAFQFGAYQTTGTAPRIIIRGDGGPTRSWQQDFYDRQIADVEKLIKRLAPKKKPKPVEVLATEALELIQDFPPIVVGDAVQRLKEAATARQKPVALAVLKAVAERARREKRRRRDEEFILMHVL